MPMLDVHDVKTNGITMPMLQLHGTKTNGMPLKQMAWGRNSQLNQYIERYVQMA